MQLKLLLFFIPVYNSVKIITWWLDEKYCMYKYISTKRLMVLSYLLSSCCSASARPPEDYHGFNLLILPWMQKASGKLERQQKTEAQRHKDSGIASSLRHQPCVMLILLTEHSKCVSSYRSVPKTLNCNSSTLPNQLKGYPTRIFNGLLQLLLRLFCTNEFMLKTYMFILCMWNYCQVVSSYQKLLGSCTA